MNNKNKNNAKQYMLFELYIVYCILYIYCKALDKNEKILNI